MANHNVSTILNNSGNNWQTQVKMSMMAKKLCGDPNLGYCGKCVDFKKRCDMFRTPPCGHSICNYCMHEHVSLHLRENVIHVPCPFKDCDIMLKPKAFKSIVPEEVIRNWEGVFLEHEMIMAQSNKKRGRDVPNERDSVDTDHTT